MLLQGYLAHKKPRAPRTLQKSYSYGPMAVVGGRSARPLPAPPHTRTCLRKPGVRPPVLAEQGYLAQDRGTPVLLAVQGYLAQTDHRLLHHIPVPA